MIKDRGSFVDKLRDYSNASIKVPTVDETMNTLKYVKITDKIQSSPDQRLPNDVFLLASEAPSFFNEEN